MKKSLLCCCLLGLAGWLGAQNITNSSFENGTLNDWTTSNGTFNVTTDYASAGQTDGNWCLRVGSTGNATLQSQSNSHLRPTNLVSFTAKTTSDSNAELLLTVNGTDYQQVRYVIRPHWCTYYLPFQADADVSLTFRFSSTAEYLIDNIRIDDQNSTDIG